MNRIIKQLTIICTILGASLTTSLFAQDVTTFLGIPVDGYKPEMKKQLLAKGFTAKRSQDTEYFEGEFNGTDVNIYISTNNNKVCRLMICDKNIQNEANIKIRFNKLVKQFENNERYVTLSEQAIDDKEDISYEMLVHNKTYDAIFFQNVVPEKMDTTFIEQKLKAELLKTYKEEDFEHPTEEMSEAAVKASLNLYSEFLKMKPVWFRIIESFGEYYIAMFYDNEYNRAQGDDL